MEWNSFFFFAPLLTQDRHAYSRQAFCRFLTGSSHGHSNMKLACEADEKISDWFNMALTLATFVCVCSWQMEARHPRPRSAWETLCCPSTASPQRAWPIWRPRIRSRPARATWTSPCRSKNWALPYSALHHSLNTLAFFQKTNKNKKTEPLFPNYWTRYIQ